jgi:hypothetical protein
MKRVLLAGLIFMATVFSVSAIGLYFDGGLGVGMAWTEIDGKDMVETLSNDSGKPNEMAVDIGVKIGLGPFDTIPIYVVGVLGGIGHRLYDADDDYFQYTSTLIGPGVIFYPIPSIQIAASLGFSAVANDNSFGVVMAESKNGFAGDVSLAFDLGAGNSGLLGGIRYFGATNTLDTGFVENSSMISFFIRYAYRHRR